MISKIVFEISKLQEFYMLTAYQEHIILQIKNIKSNFTPLHPFFQVIFGLFLKKRATINAIAKPLTLNVQYISESCTEIKIKLNFYLHTSLWCLKRFYEGL